MIDYNASEYIKYRIKKSREAYSDAKMLAAIGSWNSTINRLYYAAYYIISALLIKNQIETKSHSGVRTQFNLVFIKTGKLTKDLGQLFGDLFDSRQKGDYGDLFDFDQETVEALMVPVLELINQIEITIYMD